MATLNQPIINRKWLRQTVQPTNDLPLTEALAHLEKMAFDAPIEAEVVSWARDAIGVDEANIHEWFARAWWGHAANYAVNLRLKNGRSREVDKHIEDPDWSSLLNQLKEKRGLLLIGAHVGPAKVVRYLLEKRVLALMTITTFAKQFTGMYTIHLKDAEQQRHSLVQALAHLRSGGCVYGSADGRWGSNPSIHTFMTRKVVMYRGFSRLSRVCEVPTMQIAAHWRGHTIQIRWNIPKVEATPFNTESIIYDKCWIDDYLHWIRSLVYDSPENLRLQGGLWNVGPGGVWG